MTAKHAGRFASLTYRLVLWLYPSRVRHRFGAEQVYLFEQAWREERPQARFGLVWTMAQLLRAVSVAAMSHLDRLRPSPHYIPRAQLSRQWRVSPSWRDLRGGVRALRATPWYSAAVTVMLALGLALSTVVFAVVDGVLFKPLPYPRADELFLARVDVSGAPRVEPPPITSREAVAWADAVPGTPLTKIARTANAIATIGSRQYYATGVDDQFFAVLGVHPWLGGFVADDFVARPPQPIDRERFPRALISYGLWLSAAGGSPVIVGRQLALNPAGDRGIHVAGVLPRDFVFPLNVVDYTSTIRQPDILLPTPADTLENRDFPDYLVLARIGPRDDVQAVRERLRQATLELTRNPPPIDIHHDAQRRPPYDTVEFDAVPMLLGQRERPTFSLVVAGSALLLGLVCVNLAGLTAARSLYRQRDFVIRRALGATGWSLARGVLAELMVLAAIAVVMALLAAPALLHWTIGLLPDTVTLLKEPGLDARVFVAAGALAVASAVVVAVWPALMATRVSTFSASGRLGAASTRLGRRSGLSLLAAQAALGFILLTAGGLTLASIAAAWRSDVGYQRERIVIFEAFLKDRAATANDHEQVIALHDALREVSGVARVATTDARLFAGSTRLWSGVKPAGSQAAPPGFASRSVSAEYFDVMSLPFVDGAKPAAGEWNGNQLAVISESAARLLWPGRSPVGQQFVPVRPDRGRAPTWRVTGVVRDARYRAVDQQPVADVYLPDRMERGRYGAFFLLRTTSDPKVVIPTLTALATSRGFWTERVMPLDDALFATMRPRFLPAWLFSSFGVVGVVVMAAGAFGLLAMSAAQRTREIVIRRARGDDGPRVAPAGARSDCRGDDRHCRGSDGVALGDAVRAGASLWVTPHEPAVWIGVATVILIVAALGTLLPAARAVRVDPALALKE